MLQTGEEKNQKAREGEEQKKHIGVPLGRQRCPKGSSPQGMSGAITKSELHSPEEQRDLVIRERPKSPRKFEKSCFLVSPKGIFGKHCFCQFQ